MTGPLERAFARRRESLAQSSRRSLGAPTTSVATPQSDDSDNIHQQNRRDELEITPVLDRADNLPVGSHSEPRFVQHIGSLPVVKRRNYKINTIADRYKATKWMLDFAAENGIRHIASKCVNQFPQMFSANMKANIQKASRWWSVRNQTMLLKKAGSHTGKFSFAPTRSRKRGNLKALAGRGRKRAEWVTALYEDLRADFERLRSAGVKFDSSILRMHALRMIVDARNDSKYHESVMINGKPLAQFVTTRWIQNFMYANRIVMRAQTGKLSVSKKKKEYIEKCTAFHLGELKRAFECGDLNEDLIENADETHCVINLDNSKTLGFIGDNEVKYMDVVSGGDPMTIMMRVSGGVRASIQPPMIIFKNASRSYPIRGVADDVPGVCYRSSPKGWMDSKVWPEWISVQKSTASSVGYPQARTLFVDNCSSHMENDDVNFRLSKSNFVLRKLPPNTTELCQPCDMFVIEKFKEVWRRMWDEYKYDCVRSGEMDSTKSGKIPNPGKRFFLKMTANAIREVNRMKDKSGISFARRSMIMTGMSLNINGKWEESQLTEQLQLIIAKYRSHFNGELVDPDDGEGQDTDEDTQ